MNRDSSHRPSDADIERLLLEAVAQVRVIDISEIEQQFAGNGNDLEMDSQEAVTVIASVEVPLKCTLPGMEQLKPRQPTSIRALRELIVRHLDSPVIVD
jgi:acyl carrier protein